MKSRMFRRRNLRSKKNKTRKNRSRKNRKYQWGGDGYNLNFKVVSSPGSKVSTWTQDANINSFLYGNGDLVSDQWLDSNPKFVAILRILKKIRQKLPLTPDEIDIISKLIKGYYCDSQRYVSGTCDNAKMLIVFDKMNKGEALNSEENDLKNRMSTNIVVLVKVSDIAAYVR